MLHRSNPIRTLMKIHILLNERAIVVPVVHTASSTSTTLHSFFDFICTLLQFSCPAIFCRKHSSKSTRSALSTARSSLGRSGSFPDPRKLGSMYDRKQPVFCIPVSCVVSDQPLSAKRSTPKVGYFPRMSFFYSVEIDPYLGPRSDYVVDHPFIV